MITVIMPVYNEGDYIYQNVCRVREVLSAAGVEHQYLLVDDGSRDHSFAEMRNSIRMHCSTICFPYFTAIA